MNMEDCSMKKFGNRRVGFSSTALYPVWRSPAYIWALDGTTLNITPVGVKVKGFFNAN